MTRTIELKEINMDSFEAGYKEAFRNKKHNEKIEILFNKEGEWTGHAWGSNCSYLESDLEQNGDYRLSDDAEESLGMNLITWEDDILFKG